MTGGYRELQGVTKGYRVLQGGRRGYMGTYVLRHS